MSLDKADEARVSRRRGSAGRWVTVASLATVLLVTGVYIAVEGNLVEGLLDLREWAVSIVRTYGSAGSLALLYIEESGIPLPVPGDVYVLYLGRHAFGSLPRLIASWLGIIAVVTLGSSNLYWISRRWGARILAHPLASVFHLEPHRLARAREWFERRGVLAMIFGRHIPGFRVPLTVVAASLGFPYRKFAPSVAVSTAIWAGTFLLLGERFGRSVGRFLGHNAWLYAVGWVLILCVFGYFAFRASRVMYAARQKPG